MVYVNIGFLYHDSPVIITGNSFFNYMLRSFIISSDDFKMIPDSYNKDIDNILSAYVTFLENLFTYLRRHQCLCFLCEETIRSKNKICISQELYTYIVGKIWKLFCPVLQRVQVNLIFSNNVRLLCFFCNVKKYKTSAKMSKISILIILMVSQVTSMLILLQFHGIFLINVCIMSI
jgi:hypothetical protein